MLQHQFRHDKENTATVGPQKSFATQNYTAAKPTSTKLHSGLQRRALGDINNQQNVTLGNKDSKIHSGLADIPQKPKSLKNSNADSKKCTNGPEVAAKATVAVDDQWMSMMEREIADVREEEEDTCEDVIAMDLRPSTYKQELMTWRPASLNVVQRNIPLDTLPALLPDAEASEPQYVDDSALAAMRDAMYAELFID